MNGGLDKHNHLRAFEQLMKTSFLCLHLAPWSQPAGVLTGPASSRAPECYSAALQEPTPTTALTCRCP